MHLKVRPCAKVSAHPIQVDLNQLVLLLTYSKDDKLYMTWNIIIHVI